MRVERIDGRTLDHAAAQELADLTNAACAVDAPHIEPVSGEHERLAMRYAWDGRGRAHLFAARTDGGDLAAYAELDLPHYDNTNVVFLELNVHPAHRQSPAAHAVLGGIHDLMREQGRTTIVTNAWLDSDLAGFWQRSGLEIKSRAAQRRLIPQKLDWPRLDELHAESLRASEAYDVVEIAQPTPDELLDDMVVLQRAMNDAPLDDLDVEDHVWTPARYREHEDAIEGRAIRSVRLMARERSTGAPGGFTAVAIEDERPELGFQEDTAVVGAHRGHRLGLRLKIEMLRLLRDRDPQLVRIDTWNAESNRHMIAVNEAIGCFVVGRGLEFQGAVPS